MPKKKGDSSNNNNITPKTNTSMEVTVAVEGIGNLKESQKIQKTTTTMCWGLGKTRMRERLRKRSRRWPSSIIQTRTWKTQNKQRKYLPRSPMPMRCSQILRNAESTINRVLKASNNTNKVVDANTIMEISGGNMIIRKKNRPLISSINRMCSCSVYRLFPSSIGVKRSLSSTSLHQGMKLKTLKKSIKRLLINCTE